MTNSNSRQLISISNEVSNAQLSHFISHQLTQVLIKNYFDDTIKNSDKRSLFGCNYDDLYALLLAINEFEINTDRQLKCLSMLINTDRKEYGCCE